jgi:ABC-type transport system substrate-binding protein
MRVGGAVVAALALVGGGCSGGGSDRPSVGERAAPTTTETPRDGGVLRVGIEAPRSLDPAGARSPSDAIAADLLYDGLTAVDAKGAVVPALADRWQAAPDQTKWDFHVRTGAMFSNGQPVTPAAIVASLERARSTGTDLLKSGLGVVRSITAPAADLVHLELAEPFADLPALLSNPGYGVVGPGWTADAPVGSGPFRFDRRDGDVLHLVKAGTAAGSPHVDGVDLHLADAATSFEAFKAGTLDVSLVPPSASDEAAEKAGRTNFVPYVAEVFYGFNLKSPKFADGRFREAIVHAVDRKAIGDVVYGGSVEPIDGPVPRGLPAFQPRPCNVRCTHDVARAKALLAEAFPPGSGASPPAIAIDYDADPTQEAVAKAIQANLAAVGINASLRPHPVADYAQVVGKGEQELFRLGWVGLYPAADAFLTPLFRSGSETNVTGFSVPAVDDVLRAARAEPDPAARLEKYRDAERRIMDLVPIIPIAQFETLAVAARRVHGLAFNPLGSFDASSVWLAGS